MTRREEARDGRNRHAPRVAPYAMKGFIVTALLSLAALVGATSAGAHLERPSYWPNPNVDSSVKPATGGGVPKARSLHSALDKSRPGRTRVACAGRRPSTAKVDSAKSRLKLAEAPERARRARSPLRSGPWTAPGPATRARSRRNPSIKAMQRSLDKVRRDGGQYRLRPSQPRIKMGHDERVRLLRLNKNLLKLCDTNSVNNAIKRSRNNDRVVIMPARYTEPKSRDAQTNDPRCNPSLLQKDASGDDTPSFAYQATCPNDQNLIYLQGRKAVPDKAAADAARRPARRPRRGACVRCNMQVEGSGVKPEDVLLDAGGAVQRQGEGPDLQAGRALQARRVPRRPLRRLRGPQHALQGRARARLLHRGDRRHAPGEGQVLLERRLRAPGLHLRPPAGRRTATASARATRSSTPAPRPRPARRRPSRSGPTRRARTAPSRSATCAARRSATRARWATPCASPATTSTATARASRATRCRPPATPASPPTRSEIDNNYIYSNNLDLYKPNPPVKSLVDVPIGTGVIYPGMNDSRVHDNHFFDNWREGVRLFAVPDALVNGGGGEGDIFPGVSCPGAPANGISTSCNNQMFGNQMGLRARGLQVPEDGRRLRQRAQLGHGGPGHAQRRRLLVGRVRREHEQLLVQQQGPRRDRRQRHRTRPGRPARSAALQLLEHRPGRQRQDRDRVRLRGRPRRGHRPAGLPLVAGPAQAG